MALLELQPAMKTKDILIAVAAVMVIAGAGLFIWKNHFAAPKINTALHEGIGVALADETIRCLDNKGDILVITMADGDSEILAAQFAAFRGRIGKSNVQIKEVQLIDSEKKSKYGPGVGLSASKLTREVKKNLKKAAIVSFVGLPKLDDEEFAALGEHVPSLITFARDREKLGSLLKRGTIKAAIVPRFKFPAPGPEMPSNPGEWFTNQYQVIRPVGVTGA